MVSGSSGMEDWNMADIGFARLSSQRLILRRLRDSDLSTFCRYRSDPRVARYQDWVTFPEEDGVRFFAEQAGLHPDVEGAWFQMAIEHGETGEIVGDCAMKAIGDHPGQAEIGFTLAQDHQGKGYAAEAVTRLLDYAFGERSQHRVIAVTDARNAPAVRLLERVGMRREGHFLQNVWFKGSWGDEYLYAVLGQEWLASRGASRSGPI
jgi:RimJ/RimL family protein N-acetyltransferase